ncbi:MAG: hypothetical protein P8O91_03585 [Luminiphilus sp.]|nr:hypothetical protein [Luminiphilus sp.]
MTWVQRLKSIFVVDIEVCGRGSIRAIACIEDQQIIDTILAHLHHKEQGIPTLLPLLTRSRCASPETAPLLVEKELKFTGAQSTDTPPRNPLVSSCLCQISGGGRKSSTKPALTADTALAVFRLFRLRDYFPENPLLSTHP